MEDTEYKFFRDAKDGKKKKKKYEDMTEKEKEEYLRNKNKNADLSGFEDGGVCSKKKSYFSELKSKIKKNKK